MIPWFQASVAPNQGARTAAAAQSLPVGSNSWPPRTEMGMTVVKGSMKPLAFHRDFMGISWEFHGNLRNSWEFHRDFKEFMGISKGFHKKFIGIHGNFIGISSTSGVFFIGISKNSWEFHWDFIGISKNSWEFQRDFQHIWCFMSKPKGLESLETRWVESSLQEAEGQIQ